MFKGFTPSIQSYHELRGGKSRERTDKEYPFCMPLRRLQYENQIPCLFDDSRFKKPTRYNRKYSGKIEGVDVRLVFSLKSVTNLCAKTQKSLNKTHKKALERLLENERNSIV